MAEFRWILLGIGSLLLVGIWWWGARRSRQAAGNPELRESMAGLGGSAGPAAAVDRSSHDPTPVQESREWGVSPFEPLSIRTADFDAVPSFDQPMSAHPDPIEMTIDLHERELHSGSLPEESWDVASGTVADRETQPALEPYLEPAAEPYLELPVEPPRIAPLSAAPPDNPDRMVTGPIRVSNPSERQRIITLRVAARPDERWTGAQLMAALESHGLAHGRYQIYHRKHVDGRSLFCVASLVEPGSFNLARMAGEEFRGVTMFAVLPGPLAPSATLDALLATARGLAEELSGGVQDDKGGELTTDRVAALRADVARFQAMLD